MDEGKTARNFNATAQAVDSIVDRRVNPQLAPWRVGAVFGVVLFLLLAFVSTIFAAATQPASKPAAPEPPAGAIRIACIGDSITYGHAIQDREHQSYPARLGVLLGEKYFVRNYGSNGTTALKAGNRPYVQRPLYQAALAYKPDIVVIGLGTNDTKPANWRIARLLSPITNRLLPRLRLPTPK